MASYISWIDEAQKIIQVKTAGRWNPTELLTTLKSALSQKPEYLIWDPTEVLFLAEQNNSYQESSPERQQAVELLAKSLKEGDLRLFFILQKSSHNTFDTMRDLSILFDVEHLVFFVSSLEEAQEAIIEHQANQ